MLPGETTYRLQREEDVMEKPEIGSVWRYTDMAGPTLAGKERTVKCRRGDGWGTVEDGDGECTTFDQSDVSNGWLTFVRGPGRGESDCAAQRVTEQTPRMAKAGETWEDRRGSEPTLLTFEASTQTCKCADFGDVPQHKQLHVVGEIAGNRWCPYAVARHCTPVTHCAPQSKSPVPWRVGQRRRGEILGQAVEVGVVDFEVLGIYGEGAGETVWDVKTGYSMWRFRESWPNELVSETPADANGWVNAPHTGTQGKLTSVVYDEATHITQENYDWLVKKLADRIIKSVTREAQLPESGGRGAQRNGTLSPQDTKYASNSDDIPARGVCGLLTLGGYPCELPGGHDGVGWRCGLRHRLTKEQQEKQRDDYAMWHGHLNREAEVAESIEADKKANAEQAERHESNPVTRDRQEPYMGLHRDLGGWGVISLRGGR